MGIRNIDLLKRDPNEVVDDSGDIVDPKTGKPNWGDPPKNEDGSYIED